MARGNDSGDVADTTVKKEAERPTQRFPSSRVSASERDRMLKNARDVEFPIALRGYERVAVDRYVQQINRLIAELEISSSPESAVRHALDEVSEETRDLLQRAHHTADEITARSRAKADDRLQQAETEAQEIRAAVQREAQELREAAEREAREVRETAQQEAAELRETSRRESAELTETTAQETTALRESATREAERERAAARREAEEARDAARREAEDLLQAAESRARELAHNAEAIWRERRRLVDDMRAVGEQLVAIGDAEAKRFPRFAEDVALAVEPPRDQAASADGEPAAVPEVEQT
jgi:cell division septum initiation protein DivIVA